MTKSFFNRPALEAIHKECLDLGARKNSDYGSAGDAIAMSGLPGVVVRMLDKQMRLLSLTKAGYEAQVKDESIRDTLMDMVNYSTYAISLLDGTWGIASGGLAKAPPEIVQFLRGEQWRASEVKVMRGRKPGKFNKLKAGRRGKNDLVGHEEKLTIKIPMFDNPNGNPRKRGRPFGSKNKKAVKKMARKK